MKTEKNEKFDIYGKINTRIIENIEKAGSWLKMWGSTSAPPMNLHTKHLYNGLNKFLLWGYETPFFMTFLQIQENKLKLKKGAKSDFVVFWKKLQSVKEGAGEEQSSIINGAMLRYYNVFNIKDIEIPEGHFLSFKIKELTPEPNDNTELKKPQEIINNYIGREKIKTVNGEAAYSPALDKIYIPALSNFKGSEEFYSTYFHEMIHSTGHERRLKRQTITELANYGSNSYSKEELIAEMGAAYLSGIAEIDTERLVLNSAAYLKGWLGVLKDKKNKTFLAWAIPRAEKAAEFILNGFETE